MRWKPRRVIVYSRDELKRYEMRQDLRSEAMRCFIGDVRDEGRLRLAMEGIDRHRSHRGMGYLNGDRNEYLMEIVMDIPFFLG